MTLKNVTLELKNADCMDVCNSENSGVLPEDSVPYSGIELTLSMSTLLEG